MLKSIWNFISYWYFRYLLVTELYMVEKWERMFIHVTLVVVFSLLSYLNSAVILTSIQYFTKPFFQASNFGQFTGHQFLDSSAHSNMIS